MGKDLIQRTPREEPVSVGAKLAAALVGSALMSLVGCTNVATTASPGAGQAATGSAGKQTAAAVSPRKREFTKDQLYRLLVAEFAAKRGSLPLAIQNYLSVARQSEDAGAAERAVKLAMYARDEESSVEAAKLWAELSPDDPHARQVYGALLMRSGRLDEAVAQFEILISDSGQGSERGFDSVSELLSRERDRQAALEAMSKLFIGREKDPHALFAYARLAARAGRHEQAIELLEQLLEMDPEHSRGAVFYARLLQQDGNISEALGSLARTLEKNPDAQAVRMTYARLLVDAKRYDEARAQFETLVEIAPDNADVRYALGLLLVQTNHPEAAREQFELLARINEHRLAANFYLGQIAEMLDDLEGSLEAYRRIDRGEHFLNAQIRIAVILARQGSLDEARSHLHSLPRRNAQQDIRIYRAEAELLSENERLADAMVVYDSALDEYAGNSDLLYARAMLAEKLDLLDVLEGDLRAILKSEPDNADALNALGFTLADRTERYDEALNLISRAIELKPDDFYILDSMGWVLYRVGRHTEALEYLRRALSLSDDAEVAAHLGEVLWVTGNEDAAREVWDTALQTTPEDENLLDVIKRFSH